MNRKNNQDLDEYQILFGENVKKRRLALGLTQRELAEKLGFDSHSTIAKIEKGVRSTPLDKLPDFCRVLRCQPTELLGLTQQGPDITVTLPEGQAKLIERINDLEIVQQRQLLSTIELLIKGMEEDK